MLEQVGPQNAKDPDGTPITSDISPPQETSSSAGCAGFLFGFLYVCVVVGVFSTTAGVNASGGLFLVIPIPFLLLARLLTAQPGKQRFLRAMALTLTFFGASVVYDFLFPPTRPGLFSQLPPGPPPLASSSATLPSGRACLNQFNPYSIVSRGRFQQEAEVSFEVRDASEAAMFRRAVETQMPGVFREPEDAWLTVGGVGEDGVPFDGLHDILEICPPFRKLAAAEDEKGRERFRQALRAWYDLLDSVRPLSEATAQMQYFAFIASFPDFRPH